MQNYFVVVCGTSSITYANIVEAQKWMDKNPGAICKHFTNEDEAKKWKSEQISLYSKEHPDEIEARAKANKENKENRITQPTPLKRNKVSTKMFNIKKCVICGKPIKKKGWYCNKCILDTQKVSDFLVNELHLKYPINKADIARLVQLYPNENNIFDYLYNHPKSIFKLFNLSSKEKEQLRVTAKKDKNKNMNIDMNHIPKYILSFFDDNECKELIDIWGDEKHPKIKCKCLKCGKIFTTNYKKLSTSNLHQCDYNLSQGEFLVKKYLEENKIPFVTQYNTLKCINPKTNNILPYDFEISNKKIIIEVQGKQHIEFTPHFHKTINDFYYQQYKDKIKKDFALKNGYTFLEIFYNQFNDNEYKKILNKTINT